MDALTISAFVLSIVSVVLSIFFYFLSDKISKDIIANLNELKILTNKIEGFYNRIYEDTFSIMRKNYEVNERNQTTYLESQIQNKMGNEVEVLIKSEIGKYLNDSILSSEIAKKISSKATKLGDKIKEETYQSEILKIIDRLIEESDNIVFDDIVREANSKGFEYRTVIKEMMKLKDRGIIYFQEQPINAVTIISKTSK